MGVIIKQKNMMRSDCRSFRGSCFAGLINPVLAGLLSAKPLLHAGQETSAIGEVSLMFSPVSDRARKLTEGLRIYDLKVACLSWSGECEVCP